MASNFHDSPLRTVARERRRPKQTGTDDAQTRKVFGEHVQPELDIPEMIDDYNHNKGGVDLFSQGKSHSDLVRRDARTWRPCFGFFLGVALHNAYFAVILRQNSIRRSTPMLGLLRRSLLHIWSVQLLIVLLKKLCRRKSSFIWWSGVVRWSYAI
jgi:hypothetical protein